MRSLLSLTLLELVNAWARRHTYPAMFKQPILGKLRIVCVDGDSNLAHVRSLVVQRGQLLVREGVRTLFRMYPCVIQNLIYYMPA